MQPSMYRRRLPSLVRFAISSSRPSIKGDVLLSAIPVSWVSRPQPLSPGAALGVQHAAADLAERAALTVEADPRTSVRVLTVGVDGLLVIGDELGWVAGVTWLGRDGTSRLLLPTTVMPSVSLLLVERAFFRVQPEAAVAVLTPRCSFVGALPTRPPAPEQLRFFAAGLRQQIGAAS
jgi:hypothetical protein